MIKSNILKQTPYPEEFTEEDKIEYDTLYAQSKLIHADVEKETPFIIHLAIICHIRAKKGMAEPFTDEELQELKDRYVLKSKVIECKEPEDSYLYDKENNPIYFPSKLIINSEDGDKEIILESNPQ